jgi:divalent metal cation (Fe/Co/Zn/Cd) transporter
MWLQAVTLAWMVVECGVALYSSYRAHSPALLAFGSDSLVELLSATVVLGQLLPITRLSEALATHLAAILLYVLAAVVVAISLLSMRANTKPESSVLGITITSAALLIMPVLGWMKRREAKRLNNRALAADAVQSATCAYLAAITLLGLSLNAWLHIGWIDSLAALLAVPILLKEANAAWHGQSCC